jgi:ABC-type sugar transport system permease subunit
MWRMSRVELAARVATAVVAVIALWLWLVRDEGTAAFFLANTWLIAVGLATSWRRLGSRQRRK